MPEYIKREMPDMNGTGERKAYYQVRTYSNLSSEDFVKKICYPGSGLNKGDVSKVMCRMVDEMKRWLAEGHTITIDELGTFSHRHHIGRQREYEGVCEARLCRKRYLRKD